MYYRLVKNIQKLREDPITGIDFEHKLMEKWVSKKKVVGGNMNMVTYSTFEDEDRKFKANDENLMTKIRVRIRICWQNMKQW